MEKQKTVLILTYYWPPSGGGGVQRWLKFAKYLPSFDWKPIVFAPENPDYPVTDLSLEDDIPKELQVIKHPIWEPYHLFKKFTGRKKEEKVNTGVLYDGASSTPREKLSMWIRGNFLIPDPRVFWVRPSCRYLKKVLPELGVDAIISTGPPHSVHLIARKLRKKFNVPWVADFRDPWSEIDYLERFRLTKPAWWLQKKLEKNVLHEADEVITVSPSWAEDLERIGNRKVRVITNGFDRADFEGAENVESSKSSDVFRLTYAGFMNSLRNPVQLWQALDELCQEKPVLKDKLELKIIGTIDEDVKNHIRQYPNLSGRIHFQAYTPHNQLLEEYKNSSVLLLIQTQSKNSTGHIPGKFFEYLASLRPILMIGSEISDMAKFLKKLKAGKTNNYQEKKAIKQSLVGLFEQHQSGNVPSDANEIEAYNRENLTKQLSELLNKQLSPSQDIHTGLF